MNFTQSVPYICLLRKECKAFLPFSTSLSLWLHDLFYFGVTDHGKSQESNIANKWKSAFKRLHILQKGILKWNTKAKDIFPNALYIMQCYVKEVKISEVFQSANQLPIFFYIFFHTLIGLEKIFVKEPVTNVKYISPLCFCFMVHFHQNVKAEKLQIPLL